MRARGDHALRTVRRRLLAASAVVVLAACAEAELPEAEEVEGFELGTPGDDPTVDETDPEGAEPREDEAALFEGQDLSDATMTTRSSSFGTHVVDGSGRSLYVFALDPPGERTCTEECLATWPVFSTDTPPDGDGEVDEDLIGTIDGEDGADDGRQVTYNDQPLYYYIADGEVGDIAGQGLGDEWFLIDPDGVPIRDED